MPYEPPLADIRFALEKCADFWSLRKTGAFPDLDESLVSAILDAAGDFARDTLEPLNRIGDAHPARLSPNGEVTTAPGFKEAFAVFGEAGWQGLVAPSVFGGQALPRALGLAVHEMIHSANMSFGLAPMLSLGAIEALEAHGCPALQALYLPKLISGEWTGTMNLTEPHAGSDVGALTSRAEPRGDGTYAISGQKIFITFGEHDFTDNIVHLVLARLPGAPAGSKGISLFLVPKFIPEPDGRIGARNGVRCIGLEEKLGIHASPTCTMAYENAVGWLVGEENKGLAAMFTMMNAARVNVGLEGVALSEAAYQRALAFAKDRRQGRAEGWTGAGSSPILAHADIRRMLLTMRARTLAGRAICYATGVAADLAVHSRDEAERAKAKAREDLLTPLAKAWATDGGVEAASLGVQIHGGMGFIEETGAAQLYRDARIAPIYEGTNGIQAIDLYGRKLVGDGGAAMNALIDEAKSVADGGALGVRLKDAAAALKEATDYMLQAPRQDGLCGAAPYLDLAARVAGGMLLARGLAETKDAKEQSAVAAFYAETMLATASAALPAIKIGSSRLYDAALSDFA